MGKRITYEEVKESIESKGWTLVSDSYKNLKTGLDTLCPKGHNVSVTYEDWRKANGSYDCPICIRQPIKKINDKTPKKKEGFRILAIDQATGTSGWAVMDDKTLINYGDWSTSANHSTGKISQVKAWLDYMVQTVNPDEIILEDIQLQKFDGGEAVTTYKKLAHLQGVLKNYCYENGIPYKIIPPSTWRQYSDIKGKTRTDRKHSAQLKVKAIYDIDATQDQADAILLARCAAAEKSASAMITF